MGVQCAVPNCKNSSLKTSNSILKKKVSYHMFPKDEHYRRLWISKCYRSTSYNYENAYMCSEHFTNDDFVRDLRGELLHLPNKRKLKPNAIPSRFLGTPIDTNKTPEDTGKQKRYEMRKRNAPTEVISNETSIIVNKPAELKSKEAEVKPPSPKRVREPDDDIDTEEGLQKILNIVLERIHCLEQELEGLTHIMGDIKGRIEKIQTKH